MEPLALSPPKPPIGFLETKKVFMDEQASRIEVKLDRLLVEVHEMKGAQPGQNKRIEGLESQVQSLVTEHSKLQGILDLVKWVVPILSGAAGAGGGYLAGIF